jgi:flagellar basal-body rod protein FlgG
MTPLADQQDQIANNLANINTTGFKQSSLFAKSYHKFLENDQLQPFAENDIKADQVFVDYREGPMKSSKSPLDCCINGTGFFAVSAPDGIQYTRNGNFSLDPQGMLVTSDGSKVMGTEGFIRVEQEFPVTITERGEVLQNAESKGFLKIVDFEKPYSMRRCGESRFVPLLPGAPEQQSAGYVVRQGYLEGSNVDMIRNMVRMIGTYRTFEADQKALQAQDETLDRSVNQVGRIGN